MSCNCESRLRELEGEQNEMREKLQLLSHYVAAHEEELADQRGERAKAASADAVADALERIHERPTSPGTTVHRFTDDEQ